MKGEEGPSDMSLPKVVACHCWNFCIFHFRLAVRKNLTPTSVLHGLNNITFVKAPAFRFQTTEQRHDIVASWVQR
jgi:hypothetical protein